MKLIPFKSAALAIMVVSLSFGGQVSSAEDQTATANDIAAWVKQLGAEQWKDREAAFENLRKAGEAAKSELEKACKEGDAEVRNRADRLLGSLSTEPLLRRMTEAALKVKAMQADYVMTGDVQGMKVEMNGKLLTQTAGKKMRMTMKSNMMGQAMDAVMIMDGAILWMDMQVAGQRMIRKMSAEFMEKMGGGFDRPQSPAQAIEQFRKQFDLVAVEDGDLEGEAVHVLKGKIKENFMEEMAEKFSGNPLGPQIMMQMRTMQGLRFYVDKNGLFVQKFEILDANGGTISSMTLKNIVFDPKYEEKEFVFTPPEGVPVIDTEQMMKAAGALAPDDDE
jgi:outer membrane lipoprotein-sorting protein